MRFAIAAALLIAGVSAQSISDIEACGDAILSGIDTSALDACANKSTKDCVCSNDFSGQISDDAVKACKDAGIDPDDLKNSFCSSTSDSPAAPARHASRPMEMADTKRAYAPPVADAEMGSAEPAAPRVIYVTETKTECGCKPTPTAFDPSHLAQIPVNVPTPSSVGGMAVASWPASSSGVFAGASSSSRLFGSAATPGPSGASGQHFNSFQGAAPQLSAVQGSLAALGVAAVMGLMIAL
ncbi:hypothetical protein N7520_007672 [Penicillium odoratum]|uniref:uncharacterized protein n=1 Tax=Penicillium odoratum TaxID=1167516 RepID=UPI0025471696|nr:uncharacterized protein N7520_007672 [Penicillium odoratum]KAJ5760516.1 hypothetical protein N7520_007672 [Penicillium odoratum]